MFFRPCSHFDAQTIVPLMFVMKVMSSLHLLPKVWLHVPWRWVIILCIGTLMGTPLVVLALQYWQPNLVRGLAGTGVLMACAILWRNWHFKSASSIVWLIVTGLIVAFVNGLASIGGLVVAVYMLSSHMSYISMRAGLIAFFLVTDIYSLSWFYTYDLVSLLILSLLLFMLPAMLMGN